MATTGGHDALLAGLVLGPEHHRFQLVSELSPHPLGTLWQADDISTTQPTPVSLLFLSPQLLGQAGFQERLRDNLNRHRSLKNPFITTCYGYFHWRGLFFISWERLDGPSLQELLDSRRAQRLSPRHKQGLVSQVGHALEAGLNQLRQPHAALAPEFIQLLPSKGVRLQGFGWRPLLEPVFDRLDPPPGYRAWQAPEAFHPNLLDASADVYALACLVYQLYGGKAPFSATDDEASRGRELKAPAGLSKPQWQVLQTALAPAAEQRPATPLALVRQLYAGTDDSAPDTTAASDSSAPPVTEAVAATAPDSGPASPRHPPAVPGSPAGMPARAMIRFAAGGKRWWRGALLFALGVAAGFALALLLLPFTQPSVPLPAQEMPPPAETAAAVPVAQLDIEPASTNVQPPASSAVQAPPAPPHSASPAIADGQALRENSAAADNLTLFQDSLSDGGYSPQMVMIPKGRFRMGDLHGQGDDNERPVHEVIIAQRYALSRYEVTFAEYDLFAAATGRPLPDDGGWGRGQQPVINVSWQDAAAYARWLAQQTGQPYRLPSEAEWEYAARAGTETLYWWGDELTPGRAVCDECGSQWDGRQPAPVGSFPPSPWGLHDLNGNVDEWVQDCYRDNYAGSPQDGSARSDAGCRQRVMRGGSWFDIGRLVRSASRYRHPPDSRRNTWGFRVALDLPPAT